MAKAWIVVAALVMVALAGGAARADDKHDAIRLLDEGDALFAGGDLVGARRKFAAALALFPDSTNPSRLLGLVDAKLGHCREAIGNLERFLGKAQPGDGRVREAKAERDRCGTGVLVVESTPAGATVRLDRVATPAGTTPFRGASVATGDHEVRIELAGYRSAVALVAVEGATATRSEVVLVREEPVAPPHAVAILPSVSEPIVAAPAPRRRRTGAIVAVVIAAVVVVAAAVIGISYAATRDASPPTFPALMGMPGPLP